MNREIKFRGKDLATGKWVYGSLLQDDYGTFQLVSFIDHHETWHDIAPDTKGQYIGLTDIKGTEIYNDDILRVRGFNMEGEIEEWVVEVGQYGEIAYPTADSDYSLLVWIKNFIEYEVIGNVHDNPELLKQE